MERIWPLLKQTNLLRLRYLQKIQIRVEIMVLTLREMMAAEILEILHQILLQ